MSIFCSYAQIDGKATTDTIRAASPIEKWEYKTIYVHNTHPNAKQGEVEFKSHKDSESLDKYGSEGWELVAVTPIVAESMGNNRVYTQMLVYTFKRKIQKSR